MCEKKQSETNLRVPPIFKPSSSDKKLIEEARKSMEKEELIKLNRLFV